VPGDEVCDGSVMHVHVARTSARDLPGAELGRSNGHLEQDLTRLPVVERSRRVASPIPGIPGNRDLVLVVDVAPVKLAGLKLGDLVLGDRATGEDFWSTANHFGSTQRA
jgi:hypothetical protein